VLIFITCVGDHSLTSNVTTLVFMSGRQFSLNELAFEMDLGLNPSCN